MRMCKYFAGAVLLVAVLVGASVAKASVYGSVWMDYLPGSSSITNVDINTNTNTAGEMYGMTGTVGLGEFAFDVTGFGVGGGAAASDMELLIAGQIDYGETSEKPLLGYCIDTGQWLDTGDNRYEIRDLEDIFTMAGVSAATAAARSDDLRKLYTNNLGTVDDLEFGVAVWEIMYEDGASYDPTDGDFALDGTWTTAQGYLDNLSSTLNDDVFALYDSVSQDFSIVINGGGAVVPEPFTMATAFLAISGFGMYIRKHTRKRA